MEKEQLPEWFYLMLEARVERELMWLLYLCDKVETIEFDRHWRKSIDFAEDAGFLVPDMKLPQLIDVDDELARSFRYGQSLRQEELRDVEEAIEAEIQRKKVEELLLRKDWKALSLPTPAQLLADLQANEFRYVGSHYLSLDDDGVWVTNPYGIDCALLDRTNLDELENFLIDMARGEEYGPVPY